jgi:HAD superfamily hydrolase (TIGR01509 family)
VRGGALSGGTVPLAMAASARPLVSAVRRSSAGSPSTLFDVIERFVRDDAFSWILFDLGGVLCPDPWETLLTSPDLDLEARVGSGLAEIGRKLWAKYSVVNGTADDYWAELSDLTGVVLPRELVDAVAKDLLAPYPWAEEVLALEGVRRGVVSDNTSFWFQDQSDALDLDRSVDVRFISCQLGVTKQTRPFGLYEVAASVLTSGRVLVVDDRPWNLERAEAVGFTTLHFAPPPSA